jgi:hypothetical protein
MGLSSHGELRLPLLAFCWELRQTLTPYDAAYVALVTADARLFRASGVQCAVEQPRRRGGCIRWGAVSAVQER